MYPMYLLSERFVPQTPGEHLRDSVTGQLFPWWEVLDALAHPQAKLVLLKFDQ